MGALDGLVDGGIDVVWMLSVVYQLFLLRLSPVWPLLLIRKSLPSGSSGAAERVLVDTRLGGLGAHIVVGTKDDKGVPRTGDMGLGLGR